MRGDYYITRTDPAAMNRTRLIQRLERPRAHHSPFSFGGGGLVNGGLNEEALAQLQSVWSFNYMGAAEFEYGSVPAALTVMTARAKAGKLVARSLLVPFARINPPYNIKRRTDGEATVYVMCNVDEVDVVCERIRLLTEDEGLFNLKEVVSINRALYEPDKHSIVGWLELDNGFAFFTDGEMCRRTCALFGVDPPRGAAGRTDCEPTGL